MGQSILLFHPDPRMDNPALSSLLAQNKITRFLPTFSFPACVCSCGQAKPISWVSFELKLAELSVSSEPYTDAF